MRNTSRTRMYLQTLAAALAAVLALAAPTISWAQAADPGVDRSDEAPDEAASRLNEEGRVLVQQGEYYKALEKFRAALDQFPLSNAIFNVGSMLYTLKQYEQAFPYLEQTLKAPLSTEQRDIVQQHREHVLEALKHSHTVTMIRTNPPGARVTVNGKPMPFVAPVRVLIAYGAADVGLEADGFKSQTIVIKTTPEQPPAKSYAVRLEREEPYASVTLFCPSGADMFIDGEMRGFELVRTRLLAGPHMVRCGKTAKVVAFERKIAVTKGRANTFDFSKDSE